MYTNFVASPRATNACPTLLQQLQKLNPLLSGHSEPATPAHYADMQDV
jgi:hypothetical protein